MEEEGGFAAGNWGGEREGFGMGEKGLRIELLGRVMGFDR